ncbi:hypothetical protein MWH28_01685 [Natroniella sulfidigena]|uniref:hypothetical protein n=1 Tax=Natroniella sulfidigena TaxID=723921 RepID=UPI00200AADC0|nr:hypothetical protein [Natroniella sulfidigena]MCK8816075.1 hypothetical protein [Natroniella sulfidigena]
MLVNLEIIDFNKFRRIKLLIENQIKLAKLREKLEVPSDYEVLINGFYEPDDYSIQSNDTILFIANSQLDQLKNFS